MKNIAILMTVHNRKELTLECLKCLYSSERLGAFYFRVFVTDDGCTDGTPESIANLYPNIKILKGDGNLFWNRGMWTAWNEAAKEDPDYYMWLNDDTNLYPYAVQSLLDSSEVHDNKAIIVGATVDKNDYSKLTYGGRVGKKIVECAGEETEVDFFNGNIVLIPRDVFNKLGNLDIYFIHSKGDFDYGMRAKEEGIKMFQVGSVLGECSDHGTMDKWCDPTIPLKKRWSAMHQPNGMPPKETFYLNYKHRGFLIAVRGWVSIYIQCFFPNMWQKLKKRLGLL